MRFLPYVKSRHEFPVLLRKEYSYWIRQDTESEFWYIYRLQNMQVTGFFVPPQKRERTIWKKLPEYHEHDPVLLLQAFRVSLQVFEKRKKEAFFIMSKFDYYLRLLQELKVTENL